MGGCAHNPGSMGGKCPPHNVAEEFSHKPPGGYSGKAGKAIASPKTRRKAKKSKGEPFPKKDRFGYY